MTPQDPAAMLAEFRAMWTPWERSFLEGVATRPRPTPKQEAVLASLRKRAILFAFARRHGWQEENP
jgi:hypothetical protein